MGRTLLIIGGTGFFGKAFIRAFAAGRLAKWNVHELIITSRNAKSFNNREHYQKIANIKFTDININSSTYLPAADYIMHFATPSDAQIYREDPNGQHRDMIENMKCFKNLIMKMPTPPLAVLFTSSGAVYGSSKCNSFLESNQLGSLTEFSSERQAYAMGKISAEKIFSGISKYIPRLAIARCFAFCGPEIPLTKHFVAGNMIQNVLRGEPLTLTAKHNVVRSYLHTEELVYWLMEILSLGTNKCPIFNVGSDDGQSIFEIANALSNIYGLEVRASQPSLDYLDYYVPNIEKAGQYGLSPLRSTLKTITETIDELQKSLR